jgi:hypothetical protein
MAKSKMGVFMAWNRCVRGRRWPWLGAVVLVLAAGGASPLHAAEAIPDAKQEAKARFVSGQSHYNLNEFPEALRDFKEGYRLFPDPVFLFNLGQCERQLGHPDEAIRFYRSFLREQPKAPNRQDVLHKIEEMEALQKSKPAEADKGAPPSAPLEPAGAAKPGAQPTEEKPAPAQQKAPATPLVGAVQTPAAAPPTAPSPAAQALPAAPPANPEISGGAPDRIDLSQTTTPQPETGSAPLYSRWWFWTAAAAVVVGASVGINAATSNNGPAVPNSGLGSKKVF